MADFNYDPFSTVPTVAPEPQQNDKKAKHAMPSSPTAPTGGFNPYVDDMRARAGEATLDVAAGMARKYAQDHVPTGCTKIFKIEYYQAYFQCQTSEIMKRVWQSILVFKGNFLHEAIEGPADLWYPIWVTVTLAFALFFGIIIKFIFNIGGGNNDNLGTSTLPFVTITSLIGGYQLFVPLIFWGVCKCMGFAELRYTVISCLYGYSYTLMVPLCVALSFFQIANNKVESVPKLGDILAGSLFTAAGAWAMLFFVVQLIKYLRKIDVGKTNLLIFGLVFGLLHGGFFIAIICIFILVKF